MEKLPRPTLPPVIMDVANGMSAILVSSHLGTIFHLHDYGRKGKSWGSFSSRSLMQQPKGLETPIPHCQLLKSWNQNLEPFKTKEKQTNENKRKQTKTNENKRKQKKTKENKRKQTKTNENKRKQKKTKENKRKQKKTKENKRKQKKTKENKRKQKKTKENKPTKKETKKHSAARWRAAYDNQVVLEGWWRLGLPTCCTFLGTNE